MKWSKTGAVALWLLGGVPAYAQEKGLDKEVWVTLGAEALEPARATFASAGWELPAPARERGGVAAVRVRESQLGKLSEMMHDRFHRCGGFIAHNSREEAVAAVDKAVSTASLQPLAVSYTLDNATVVNSLMAGLQEANIRSTITTLSGYATRYYTSQSSYDAATWLKNLWTSYAAGRSDVTVSFFNHAAWRQPSVILTITGGTLPNEVVVIGGHLDSTNSSNTASAPGADDDASGVATLTEVIRVAMAQNFRPQRTVKFMAYAAEEVGLRGSNEIATQHKTAGINVVGVLQLDMTNYRGSSWDFTMVTDNTNAAQNQFVTNLIGTYLPGQTWTNITCGYGCSDHASWHSQGFAASMPFEALMNQYNPYIHTSNDTLDKSGSTANNALKFSKLAAAYLAELAKGTLNGDPLPPPPPPPPSPVAATYDATLKAPKCGTVGIGCDSGTLLNGRANLGPEPNKPNTLNSSCQDGVSGTYHRDESIDRLRVVTTDSTNLAAGKQVRIEATVWAYSTTADKLDLYYTANANSPTWTFIGTLSPGGTGARTLSATYTLPSGSLQAVRARFRYNGTVGACGTGSYDDHDDLIFAVP